MCLIEKSTPVYCRGMNSTLIDGQWLHVWPNDILIESLLYIIAFYYIRYGVIQGFRALKKAVQHTRYNIVFFQVCLISPISCRHVTRISRHSVSLMNERWSRHHPQSKVVCRNFFGITAAKTLKNPYHLQTVTIKLLKKGKKTKIRKEKPKAIRIQWLW